MILAIFENISDAEALLNSLDEAEFNLNDLSVLMKDVRQHDSISKDTAGPLQGAQITEIVEWLIKAGETEAEAKVCHEAVDKGKILVVMNVDPKYSQAAQEIFQDHSAQLIKG